MSTTFSADADRDEQIKIAIARFFAAWGPPPNEDQVAIWLDKLRPHWGKPELREALRAFTSASTTQRYPPSIPEVLAKMHALAPPKSTGAPPLTQQDRAKARHAAMLSALWMHYEFGWELEGESLKALFGADVRQAAALAKAKHPREDVKRWMAERAIDDPLPCDKQLIASGRL